MGLPFPPSYAPSQLVQRRQPKTFCADNCHMQRFWYVDPHFYDSGGNKNGYFPFAKCFHNTLLFLFFHTPMQAAYGYTGQRICKFLCYLLHRKTFISLCFFYKRTNHIAAVIHCSFIPQIANQFCPLVLAHQMRLYSQTSGRHFIHSRKLQISI